LLSCVLLMLLVVARVGAPPLKSESYFACGAVSATLINYVQYLILTHLSAVLFCDPHPVGTVYGT
jgi:hypothetical protein